ncbi:MAG TPA: (2Fe-2S)-binding protein [Exilispira sp.]|jgi:carbon-monoxide dehydrogenase small subunit|nr:(2Fe-2S)-binding protein [Exilispira sp.]HQM88803.1 (2Fe-2S)-binding protein [Exilispira sp.]HQQ19061.1 (2Fe-2S)-binding protein [Exilispira sp.]
MASFGKLHKKGSMDGDLELSLNINNLDVKCKTSGSTTLLNLLRELGYVEVKCGCEEGACGSCLVLLNGRAVNSCQVFAATVDNARILTVNGLGNSGNPHPIELAFVEAQAVQCGFCTPGMIIATYELLSKNPSPSEEDIKVALSGNLCRCTGYVKIIDAVKLAVRKLKNK